MAKAVVLGYLDADPGADDNNVVLLAEVLFVGTGVPGSVIKDRGAAGNGVPISWDINAPAAQFSNNVETALTIRATQLGFTLANTDVLFPALNRGN